MKSITFFSFVLSVALCVSFAFAVTVPKGLVIPTAIKQSLREKIELQGCNANICFGIDGSGSVSRGEYQKAKDFVKDIVDIVGTDRAAEFAAVEFTFSNTRISSMTGNKDQFLRRVLAHPYVPGGATSIGAGIVYCDFQLARRKGEANKMVILTDGRNTIGGDPVERAENFRRRDGKGKVCAVGVGNQQKSALEKIAGDKSLVLTVKQYIDLALIVDDLVQDICGFSI